MSAWLVHRLTRYLVKYYFWICLWGFLNEINIWSSRLNKADCPFQCGWASSNLSSERLNKSEFFLCLTVFGQVPWYSPAFGLGFWLELTPSALLVLQYADCRSWIFQPPYLHEPSHSLIVNPNLCIYVSINHLSSIHLPHLLLVQFLGQLRQIYLPNQ